MPDQEFYTEEEVELIRQQLRTGVQSAHETARGRYKLHPKIAAKRAAEKAGEEKS